MKDYTRLLFLILILLIGLSGLTQGMLIPLLTVILEERGVSSTTNGLNATALYIGTIIISPFMAVMLKRLGYKTTILFGLLMSLLPLLLFPVFSSLAIWFLLRILIGFGDVFLHYTTQIWVTNISASEHRGRNLTLYGLAYGIGFSVGPQGIYLLSLGLTAPFIAIGIIYIFSIMILTKVNNERPFYPDRERTENSYLAVLKLGWLAMIPSFVFGYMEATLNNSLPIYLIRLGNGREWIPIILFSFVIGGLILQLPLGYLSDKFNRKSIILSCSLIGSIIFIIIPWVEQAPMTMAFLLAIAGAAVGSFYSLGLAFAVDILPKYLIPTAGIITGINYSIASIVAPVLNGYILSYLNHNLIFILISAMLALFVILGLFHKSN